MPFLLWRRGVPPNGGVVVVGPGVGDAVLGIVVGKEGVGFVIVEGKLENLHPGQAQLVAQVEDLG